MPGTEYEKFVRILYAPTLSADWPRLAMVRSIYQQITYLDPVVHDWEHIKSKALVLGGERDGQNFPALAKHIADAIPGGQLVIIPKVGHVPHIQVPEIFNRELLKFLLE
jgi:pimeloyl-ACP methyl ester carboxylesterase